MSVDLTLVWAGLLAFAVFAYIVMDGFDLGVGILFPTLKAGDQRDKAMNSIAPVWDGNETWLILGGGGLFAAFPLAYAVLMPAVYTPIIAMLLGLVFRGVAFEYRWRTVRAKPVWDVAFFGGSCWPPSPRASPWGPSCRGSRCRAAPMAAAGGTGSAPSAC